MAGIIERSSGRLVRFPRTVAAPAAETTDRRHAPRHRALYLGRHRRPGRLPDSLHPRSRRRAVAGRFLFGTARPALMVLLAAALSLLPLLGVPNASWASWTVALTGQGTAGTGTLTAPGEVTVTAAGWRDEAPITWTDSTSSAPTPPAIGYYVTRVDTATGTSAPACGTSPGSPTTRTACTDTGIPDGSYRYIVTAAHATWTAASAPSRAVTVQSDTAAPTVTIAGTYPTPTAGGLYPGSPVVLTLAAQDPGGSGAATLSYSVDGGQPTLVPGDTTTVVVSGEGPHTITYEASDEAGNLSQAARTTVTIDSLRPGVTVQRAPAQPDATNESPITFQVTFSEPVTGFTAEDVQLSGAGATADSLAATVTGDGADYKVAVIGMTGAGEVVLTIPEDAAHDAAGHGNTASIPDGPDASVTFDTTASRAPSPPELASSSDTGTSDTDGITQTTELLLTGTAEPGSAVTVYSDGTAGSTATTGGAGSYSTTTAPLPQDTHLPTVVATDAAGNKGPASGPTRVSIDTTGPAVLLTATSYTGSTGNVLVTGTAGTDPTDDSFVTLVICAVNTFPCTTRETLDTQVVRVDLATGAWSVTSTNLRTCTGESEGIPICTGPGTVYLRATQADLAGNTAASTTTEATFP